MKQQWHTSIICWRAYVSISFMCAFLPINVGIHEVYPYCVDVIDLDIKPNSKIGEPSGSFSLANLRGWWRGSPARRSVWSCVQGQAQIQEFSKGGPARRNRGDEAFQKLKQNVKSHRKQINLTLTALGSDTFTVWLSTVQDEAIRMSPKNWAGQTKLGRCVPAGCSLKPSLNNERLCCINFLPFVSDLCSFCTRRRRRRLLFQQRANNACRRCICRRNASAANLSVRHVVSDKRCTALQQHRLAASSSASAIGWLPKQVAHP